MAFTEWSKGTYTYRKLSDYLAERGFRSKSGKKIYQQTIEKIIRNQIYFGQIKAFDMEVQGAFEAIIPEDLFWKCQPNQHKKIAITKRDAQNPKFPLKKHTVCTQCYTSLTGSSSTGRSGKKYPYYHHHKQNCELAVSHSKADVEKKFLEYLEKISPTHKQYEALFKRIVLDVWQTNYKRLDAENERIRREIGSLESDRQKVFDAHRNAVYNDTEFLDQKNYLNARIREKKLMLEEKQIEEFNMENALSFCFEMVRDSALTWTNLEKHPEFRARFQKLIFPENIEFDGEKFGTNKLGLVYRLKETYDADSSNLVIPRGIEPRFHG